MIVDALLKWNDVLAWMRLTDARQLRPQSLYNAACARAIDVPKLPDDDGDAIDKWKKANDPAVVRIVELLARSCLGEGNLVEW